MGFLTVHKRTDYLFLFLFFRTVSKFCLSYCFLHKKIFRVSLKKVQFCHVIIQSYKCSLENVKIYLFKLFDLTKIFVLSLIIVEIT